MKLAPNLARSTIHVSRETAIMTTHAFHAQYPAHARRGFARMIAAVTAAFAAAVDVIDEATDQSAAARRRFPSAD